MEINSLNLRKLSLVIAIALVWAGILACQIPGMAGKPTNSTTCLLPGAEVDAPRPW